MRNGNLHADHTSSCYVGIDPWNNQSRIRYSWKGSLLLKKKLRESKTITRRVLFRDLHNPLDTRVDTIDRLPVTEKTATKTLVCKYWATNPESHEQTPVKLTQADPRQVNARDLEAGTEARTHSIASTHNGIKRKLRERTHCN